ncbi:MAG: DUF4105 domain-containing protein [Deltaproteobacteria bacterium]|nr:DUF4105 domain-containing protein [Deltaproteobacteria bacterium]
MIPFRVLGPTLSLLLATTGTSTTPVVELITMGPGPELYSYWGHAALRIIDPQDGSDRVYNFGSVDFSDGFFVRMMRGQVDAFIGVSTYPGPKPPTSVKIGPSNAAPWPSPPAPLRPSAKRSAKTTGRRRPTATTTSSTTARPGWRCSWTKPAAANCETIAPRRRPPPFGRGPWPSWRPTPSPPPPSIFVWPTASIDRSRASRRPSCPTPWRPNSINDRAWSWPGPRSIKPRRSGPTVRGG